MNYYLMVLKKYAVFDGRSTRPEYWYFILFNFIISLVLGMIDGAIAANTNLPGNFSLLGSVYSLAVLIPGIAVMIRRLHDIGKSGWWFFICLIPLAGIIWLIVLLATDSKADNQYGPNPKATPMAPFATPPTSPTPPTPGM